MWYHRGLGSNGSLLTILTIFAFAMVTIGACSSSPQPAQEPKLSSFTSEADVTPNPDVAPLSIAPVIAPAAQVPSAPVPSVAGFVALPSLSTLVDRVEPAVASISVESVSRGLFFDFTDEGAGTGMIISADGYIVTNNHVIQSAEQIMVNLPNGESYPARVIGVDRITDLAVIKIEAEGLPTMKFGDSDQIDVGDWVVALGNALALKGGPSVTLGIISARGRTVTTDRGDLYDMIQTDAAINDGNSGGPLINLDGEVIGINTAILRQAQGIGFAISSSVASPIIESLIEHGRVTRPLIGLTGADVTPARANQLRLNLNEGIIVTRMSQDGPAYEAGIRVGDVITKMNDIPTPDMARFLTLLWALDVGDGVVVEYVRDNEANSTTVTLVERPSGT